MSERGVAPRAHFTGRVSHAEVLKLVADADICLDVAPCTPLNNRTTMVKIAEYMALGKPVVSFALDETRATGGDAVVYVPCGDWDAYVACVSELARDAERRLAYGRAARERSRQLVWSFSARVLTDSYSRVVLPPRLPERTAR
jgi:glycosyltransferase involved in cell wall biosynthesis